MVGAEARRRESSLKYSIITFPAAVRVEGVSQALEGAENKRCVLAFCCKDQKLPPLGGLKPHRLLIQADVQHWLYSLWDLSGEKHTEADKLKMSETNFPSTFLVVIGEILLVNLCGIYSQQSLPLRIQMKGSFLTIIVLLIESKCHAFYPEQTEYPASKTTQNRTTFSLVQGRRPLSWSSPVLYRPVWLPPAGNGFPLQTGFPWPVEPALPAPQQAESWGNTAPKERSSVLDPEEGAPPWMEEQGGASSRGCLTFPRVTEWQVPAFIDSLPHSLTVLVLIIKSFKFDRTFQYLILQ